MTSDSLANFAGRFIGNLLANYIAVVFHTKIQIATAMLIQNDGYGYNGFFYFTIPLR